MSREGAVKPVLRGPERKARFIDLLASEWIRLWSLRSTLWALATAFLIILAISVNGALSNYRRIPGMSPEDQEYFRSFGALGVSFPMGAATVLALGAGAIGAIAILGDYTTGMIRTTFTAVPARRAVLAAKALVIAGITAAFGAAVALASFGLTQGILSGRDAAVGFGAPAALRLLAATAVLAPVSALVGMGMAVVIRNSVLTIVATITLLFVLPSLLNGRQQTRATIMHMMVLPAWQRLTCVDTEGTPWPWTTTGAWLVLATWAAVATALVVLPSNRRDL